MKIFTMKKREEFIKNKIKEILHEQEMTQQELADNLGIGKSHMSRIINGEHSQISIGTALRIAKILDRPVEDIFELL